MRKKSEEYYLELGQTIEIKNELEKLAKEGEVFIQCLDKETFGGEFYYPHLFVSNFGRIYSLKNRRLFKIVLHEGDKYYKFDVDGIKKYVHRLVANYFCDKSVIKRYGNDIKLYEVNHKKEIDKSKSNEENNYAENLEWVYRENHPAITALQLGKKSSDGKYFVQPEFDLFRKSCKENEAIVSLEESYEGETGEGERRFCVTETLTVNFQKGSHKVGDVGFYYDKEKKDWLQCKIVEIIYFQGKIHSHIDDNIHYLVEFENDKSRTEICCTEFSEDKRHGINGKKNFQ